MEITIQITKCKLTDEKKDTRKMSLNIALRRVSSVLCTDIQGGGGGRRWWWGGGAMMTITRPNKTKWKIRYAQIFNKLWHYVCKQHKIESLAAGGLIKIINFSSKLCIQL